MLRVEFVEVAKEMTMDELRLALDVFQAELAQRQGLEKFTLPEHIERLLN